MNTIALLQKLKHNVESLTVQEQRLASPTPQHCVPQAVEYAERQQCVTTRTGDIGILKVADHNVDSPLLTEQLFILFAISAKVGYYRKATLLDLERVVVTLLEEFDKVIHNTLLSNPQLVRLIEQARIVEGF